MKERKKERKKNIYVFLSFFFSFDNLYLRGSMYLVYGSISGLVTILQALANLRLDSYVAMYVLILLFCLEFSVILKPKNNHPIAFHC